MDRSTRLFLAHAIVERTRDYADDALNDLFPAMDDIGQARGLIPQLTEAEAAVAVAEKKLARGEHLPEDEQDSIFDMILLLIDIDAPALRLSPEQIAGLRRRLREHEEGGSKDTTGEKVDVGLDRSRT
jgi:hypothetical protein